MDGGDHRLAAPLDGRDGPLHGLDLPAEPLPGAAAVGAGGEGGGGGDDGAEGGEVDAGAEVVAGAGEDDGEGVGAAVEGGEGEGELGEAAEGEGVAGGRAVEAEVEDGGAGARSDDFQGLEFLHLWSEKEKKENKIWRRRRGFSSQLLGAGGGNGVASFVGRCPLGRAGFGSVRVRSGRQCAFPRLSCAKRCLPQLVRRNSTRVRFSFFWGGGSKTSYFVEVFLILIQLWQNFEE